MIIGVPKEIQDEEYRVAVLPQGVGRLTAAGHTVWVQNGAGDGAGFPDAQYTAAGAQLVSGAADLLRRADLVVKVKEPVAQEYPLYPEGRALFCYLYTEKRPELLDMLIGKRVTGIAYEGIRLADGTCPLLRPMSIIAGQQAVLQGMQFLCNHRGGVGQSLVRYPGIAPAVVVVLGAGVVGSHAARVAAALGAEVHLFEKDLVRIRQVASDLPPHIHLYQIDAVPLEPIVCTADLVINAATVPPRSGGHLIDRTMVSRMKKGSVIVDVTVYLGEGVETIDRYTSHRAPVWEVDGVIHYAVPNIPGTVARTASQALAMEVLPYLLEIAEKGIPRVFQRNRVLRNALSTVNGMLTSEKTGRYLGRGWISPEKALA